MAGIRDPKNVPGPFYVEADCCTMCGVPEFYAPEMFGADERPQCFVKKQPDSPAAIDRAILVMLTADLSCVRYGGADREILARLADLDQANLCDEAIPPGIEPVRRDHVAVATADTGLLKLTADQVATLLTADIQGKLAPPFRVVVAQRSSKRCEFSISWFNGAFHRVTVTLVDQPDVRWLIAHEGPVGLSITIHEWLARQPNCSVRWLTADEWSTRQAGRLLPW